MLPPDRQMTCKELVELLSAYLDDALELGDRDRLERHLERCSGCRSHLRQFQLMLDAMSAVPGPTIEPPYLDELIRVYKATKPTEL